MNLDDFPCQLTIPVRWNDIGADGRVGPVELARYYEDSRVALIRQMHRDSPLAHRGFKVFVARLYAEQFRPVSFPQDLLMGAGISRIGNSSYVITIAAFADGVCVGRSETMNVAVDDHSRPMPIPDNYREILARESVADAGQRTPAGRPTPQRLELDRYPHQLELDTRFSDTDLIGHINNVSILRYYDDGLASLLAEAHDSWQPLLEQGAGLTVVSDTAFVGESHHSYALRVGSAVSRVDEQTLTVEQGLFQRGNCVGVRDLRLELEELPAALRDRLSGYAPV